MNADTRRDYTKFRDGPKRSMSMQKMSGDVEHLIECMMKQFESMRTDYSDQLKDIELRFESEREAILKANEKHIESLFAEHKKVEEDFLNKR